MKIEKIKKEILNLHTYTHGMVKCSDYREPDYMYYKSEEFLSKEQVLEILDRYILQEKKEKKNDWIKKQ